MSVINAQLKTTLIAAIKEKQIKILESNKVLLKIIEEGIDSKINSANNNTETLENLDVETLSRIFTSLEVPFGYTNTQINILSKIIELFGEKENNFLCVLLDRAINDFVVNRFTGKPQEFHSRVNPVNNPFSQPVFMQPGFQHPGFNQPGFPQPGFQQPGFQNQPGFPQSGFQQPGFQNQPSDFYPNIFGFGPNTNGFQQPFSSVNQKSPNKSEDEQVNSIKSPTTEVSFKNLPWKDLELIDIMIGTISDGYKKP